MKKLLKELLDQALHFAAGFLLGLLFGPWWGIGVGVLRELLQNWGDDDNDYLDMAIDLTVWFAGVGAAQVFR